jgi:hypothetical protein
MNISKKQAIGENGIFESAAELGRALGITRSAVYQWGELYDERQTAMVIGAAIQLGKPVPPDFVGKDATQVV